MRSARALAVIAALLEDHQRTEPHHEDMCRLCRDARSVLMAKPKRSVRAHKSEKAKKDRTKKEETAEIRAAVATRAGGQCEACCGGFTEFDLPEMDHFFGRGKVRQAVSNCWLLHRSCHRAKTNNRPDAGWWLVTFRAHANSHGYDREVDECDKRLAFVEARAALSRGVAARE